ncbi:MAG: DivIVA domain-containing protein [Rubrobacter sp.]|nr:DivIVA domain-containing protein [Rubrobacter sp.]
MAIRPVDVRRKEFKSTLRGYDANQVDDFLDELADEFERAFAENQRLSDEVKNLKERLEQFEELETSIREALVHAQQVSRDLRRNATKEAELIVREANEQSHRILADSSARVERVQESYEVLRKAKQDFANDFRYLLKSYMDVMDNADVATAKEIEASLRDRLDLESVAAAREAAETRSREGEREGPTTRSDEDTQASDTQTGDTEGGGAAEQVEVATTPAGGAAGPDVAEHGPEPEVEEPEEDPSTIQSPAAQESASDEVTVTQDPDAADEVDREESMPTGGNRAYDEFFEGDRERAGEDAEEGKRFRASRFLRRRG